jgi:hypothetical protein
MPASPCDLQIISQLHPLVNGFFKKKQKYFEKNSITWFLVLTIGEKCGILSLLKRNEKEE